MKTRNLFATKGQPEIISRITNAKECSAESGQSKCGPMKEKTNALDPGSVILMKSPTAVAENQNDRFGDNQSYIGARAGSMWSTGAYCEDPTQKVPIEVIQTPIADNKPRRKLKKTPAPRKRRSVKSTYCSPFVRTQRKLPVSK